MNSLYKRIPTILKRICNKKLPKTIWILYALSSIFIILYFADSLYCKDLDEVSQKVTINSDWNVTIDDKHYEHVNLTDLQFEPVNKGTKIILQTTLPAEWSFEEPALCYHVRQTTVDMYADDELFYQYGQERAASGKTVGSGIQLINFSNNYKGKTLRIELQVMENHAFSSFDSVWLSEWSNSYRFIVTENRLPMFLGCFLIVMGVVVSLILTFAVALSRKYVSVLCLSMFSICMGMWTLSYHNVLLIFSAPLYSISLLEYMTLILAPLPIIGYMYGYVKQLKNRHFMLAYKILFVVQFVLTVVTITLHTKDIVHCAQVLPYYHVMFVIHSLFFSYVLYKGSKNNQQKKTLYICGLIIVIACIIYEMLCYITNRYLGVHIVNVKGISSLGIIVFMAILILDLYHDVTSKMMEEQEKALLIQRAYTDELTHIHNRTYCSDYMNKLQADENSVYTIINFDLNDLKKTNDTLGHAMGDRLITTAANVISDSFSSVGSVCRMGGDEFIAILPTNDVNQIDALLHSFDTLIDATNQKIPNLHLSISYGYATNDEVAERNIEKVYQVADGRMYESKRAFKAQRAKALGSLG